MERRALEVVFDPNDSPVHHMLYDQDIVEKEGMSPVCPFLRFYTWPKSGAMTLGRFLSVDSLLNKKGCDRLGISYAMRPTGGGLLLHGSFDCGFSLFLPAGHPCISSQPKENYRRIHAILSQALFHLLGEEQGGCCIHREISPQRPLLCMASKTEYDILFSGHKVGGSACRMTRQGLLFQASIFLNAPEWSRFLPCLQKGEEAIASMKAVSSSLQELLPAERTISIEEVQEQVKRAFLTSSINAKTS